MHDEMAKLKTDLAQMTQTYMQEMQALLMETLTHAMENQASVEQSTNGEDIDVPKK